MPLIPPRFPSNNSSVQGPPNKPPWARGPAANNSSQNNEIPPWRRNLKSVKAPAPINNAVVSNNTSLPVPGDQPTKTSKLQINLKSVKKPDQGQENSEKVIPIQIQTTTDQNKKPVVSTTIPIQLKRNKEATVSTIPSTEDKEMPKSSGALPPAPPPLPGGPPPPPPPPAEGANIKHVKIEQLRKAPKKRPDWAGMMKEIEKGRVLNHVECNDRSRPIIPKLKSRGRFVFESEAKPASKSDALHNRLLNEIQQGVKLKRVQCNDRSKPILSGLRVRRQSSVVDGEGTLLPMEPVDELAYLDIDVLRDELQSAKHMLETEIDSKHLLERKTRDQKCQIIAMEAEIETLKAKLGIIPEEEVSVLARNLEKSDSKTFKHLRKSGSSLWKSPSVAGIKKSKSGLTKQSPSDTNVNKLDQNVEEDLTEVNEFEEEIASLKDAVQHARKQAEEMEAKYKSAMEQLQNVQNNFEDSEQKRKALEKQVETIEAQNGNRPLPPAIQTAERTTQTEEQILERMANLARQQSTATDADYDSEEESDSDMEVDEISVQKKKQERELKLWENKLKSIKDKQNTSRVERKNLKNLQKKLEEELKEANKRHKKLQKEVDKMAKMMMKEAEKDDSDEEEQEEEEPEEEEEEEETEEEEESEEEDSESDSDDEDAEESSEEDDENASYDDRMAVVGKKVKKRENVLNAMRKGNYLLRANIDRLKDDLEEARIAYHDLEHELNAVLDET